MSMPSLIVDPTKCTKCGICVKVCPSKLINFGESGFPEMDARHAAQCIECGHCAMFCPACANSLSFLKAEDMVKVADLPMPKKEEGLNLLRTRRSIRRFKQESVSKEIFDEMFEVVKMAPTACNDQPVRWIVSEDPQKTKDITNYVLSWLRGEIFKDPVAPLSLVAAQMIARAREGEDMILRGAPHVAMAVVPKEHRWPQDASIALTYLELAAHAAGVGACWGGFLTLAVESSEDIRKFLGIGDDEVMVGAQMLGYPSLRPTRQFAPRRELNITRL